MCVPSHSDIPGNFRADELARAVALLPEFSSIELGAPLASIKLDMERKFFRDANLSWVNEESCSIARLNCPLMLKRRANHLLDLSREVISNTVAVLTGHCVMGRHAKRMRLISAVDADPLRRSRLLSTFFVSAHLMLGIDIGSLAPHFLSA